jgi:uncharacterized protein with ParB-like and HNH nuclease domain
MENKFKTDIVNLESLDQFDFKIPTYQRPYVWGDEQLKKLLDDFYQSFKNDGHSIYYVSTFLTKEEGNVAELIDGQQRFTTLWLITLVLSRLCPESAITQFLKKGGQLRLGFEIRKEVSEFLKSLMEEDSTYHKVQDKDFIAQQPYLKNIARALVFINGYIKQAIPEEDYLHFGNYIYKNVHLVKNTTPANTDLNKLFSTINSAGVQLEQTDIVKANLLNLIDEKVMYGKIWEACENMSDFFERNARVSFPESNWRKIDLSNHIAFAPSIFNYKSEGATTPHHPDSFSIDNLDIDKLIEYQFPPKRYEDEKGRDSEEVYCRSIINFGQLLLHTYRLHLHKENLKDFQGTFHVSRLIEIFKDLEKRNNPDEIKRFFRLLWDVRFLFDKYIVKWVSDVDTKNESLEIVNFNRNQESYYSRTKYEKSNSLMLQSVLYFTGDYLRQYWLTTYLGYLLDKHANLPATNPEHLTFLEKIDNIFSLTYSQTDKELSWNLLNLNYTVEPDFNIENYLSESHGTKFKHYWFQKLEYVLWKNWSEENKTEAFKNYRIVSRNSVEHIYPQKDAKIDDVFLHSFGNLVLLSVSQNSEYGAKPVSVKRSMFMEKKNTYDTLKSYFVFKEDSELSEEKIKAHQKDMVNAIKEHYRIKSYDAI